jgi:hypothetical protein
VSLEYYKKENNCKLVINGKAYIETANTEFPGNPFYNKLVLLKVKIVKAEYFENKMTSLSFRDKIKSAINYIMAATPRRMYDFSS